MQGSHRNGISRVVSVLVIVIIVLGAGLGYEYATNYNQRQSTVTVQNTVTSTKTVTETVNATVIQTKISNQTVTVTTSTYCVQSVAGTLRVMVVQDASRAPVEGVDIYGAASDSCGSFSVGPVTTPTNGTVLLAGDVANYFLVANYAGHNYSFVATVYPVTTTNVTLSIPSGNVSTTYSKPFGSST
ncbi:MAG: hypothetical protein JRN15_13015 [Nitrososphaerota archaeon]|nr:hypothetical protein [Nitrososphaerota archaeon]